MNKYIPQAFMVLIVAYLLFLIRPVLLGQLTGTFQPHAIPNDYIKLEKFLDSQSTFSSTFWVPTTQRFGFFSNNHPEISAYTFFNVGSPSGVLYDLRQQIAENTLQEAGVKYVVIPYDSEGEIFLSNRKYSEKLYQSTVRLVQKISWLKEIPGFGRIHVFQVSNSKDHFWLTGKGSVSYKFIDPTHYKVFVKGVSKGETLVFSETYDKYWQAEIVKSEKLKTKSETYDKRFNSFVLPESGNYSLDVMYTPQEWVNIGLWVSGTSALAICLYFAAYFIYEKRTKR